MSAATPSIRVSDLLARTVEEGDCLLWTGHATQGKHPQWRLGGKVYPARRIVYEAVYGHVPGRMQVGVRCGNALCVHPDCLVARSKSKAMRGPKRADFPARMAAAKRSNSQLDIADIRAIRASDEPGPVIEARYGLKKGYASRIRTHRCWVDFSSPFAGLGAKA